MGLDRRLIEAVAAAVREGREDRVALVLPTHHLQALARERILAEDGVEGARHLNVWSFYQFANHLLTAAGLRRQPVNDALRRFILLHLARAEAAAGRLNHFQPLAGSAGLAAGVSRLIGELKLAGATPEAVERALAQVPAVGATARGALRLYRLYQEFLAERGLADQEELLLLALGALQADPSLVKGYTLLFTDFHDLMPVQAELIRAAEKMARVEALLPESEPFAGPVTLTRAPGPEREVRQVAKDLKRLILGAGVAPGETAVLLADPSYAPLVVSVLDEEGLPCDQGGEAPLAGSPVVRSILLCLETALALRTGFDLLNLVRSAYLPGGEEELAALRRAFRERGYLLTRDEWERRLTAAVGREERRAAAQATEEGLADSTGERRVEGLRRAAALLRELLDPLAELPARCGLTGHLTALERLLERFGLEAAILSPEVDEELRVRDWTALGAFRQLLADLARGGDLLPEAGEITLSEFLGLLRASLSEASYPVTPAAPGGVAVRTLTQSRGVTFRHVFLTGLRDGILPRARREDWLFPESLRRALGEHGLRLETAREAAAREQSLFRLGLSRAEEGLSLSFAECDAAGRIQLASPFLEDFCLAAGGRVAARVIPLSGSVPSSLDEVTTERELALYTAAAGRAHPPAGEVRTGQIVNPAALAALAAGHGPEFAWSAGRFGDYRRCPFRYFLQRELLATPVEEAAEELTPQEQGNLCHEILRRYYAEGGQAALERDPAAREEALRRIAGEVCAESPVRWLVPHAAFWEGHQERLVGTLLEALARDADCAAQTGFRPRYLEWGFGLRGARNMDPASTAQPLRLGEDERAVTVVGKVDRIDVDETGRFVVYDYKTGSFPGWRDEESGRSLQLRLYLEAVRRLLLPAGRPAGAAYYQLKPAECTAKEGLWHRELAAGVTRFNRRKVGLFAAEEWQALLSGTASSAAGVVEEIRAGRFPLADDPQAHWKCRFRGACRVDECCAPGEDEDQ